MVLDRTVRHLPDQQVQVEHIATGLAIVLPSQCEEGVPILVGSKPPFTVLAR